MLGGIVGMHFYDGTLVIIEDGMVPKRVMRLALSPDGHTIKGAMPLDVASQDFIALGDGTHRRRQTVLHHQPPGFAVRPQRRAHRPSDAEPEAVFASNVRFAWGKVGAAMSAPIPVQVGIAEGRRKKKPARRSQPSGDKKH